MIDAAIVMLLGILAGIGIGLFPVLPIYLGAFILYFVGGVWTPEVMLLFWAVSAIGSQFFGSVSAITLGIPGDASSAIYINQVKSLSLSERNRLLWQTARGSLISGALALVVVWVLYHYYLSTNSIFLTTVNAKFALLSLVVIFTIALSEKKLFAIALAIMGLLIAPRNNYVLPDEWYTVSLWFQHSTFFMLILGLMILPDLFTYKAQKLENHTYQPNAEKLPKWLVIKNAILGCVVGLVPGPAAETAAAAAYSLEHKQTPKHRIIAAETANNPGVIMMLLPFFLLGLPFTPSSLVVSNIMDAEVVDIVLLGQETSTITSLTVFDSIIALSLLSVLFYYLLSIHFINFYVKLVSASQNYLKTVLLVIVSALMFADMFIQEITPGTYLTLIAFYIGLGLLLKRFRINPIPLVFVYLLGDQLIWASIQFVKINF